MQWCCCESTEVGSPKVTQSWSGEDQKCCTAPATVSSYGKSKTPYYFLKNNWTRPEGAQWWLGPTVPLSLYPLQLCYWWLLTSSCVGSPACSPGDSPPWSRSIKIITRKTHPSLRVIGLLQMELCVITALCCFHGAGDDGYRHVKLKPSNKLAEWDRTLSFQSVQFLG